MRKIAGIALIFGLAAAWASLPKPVENASMLGISPSNLIKTIDTKALPEEKIDDPV